ncbi:MAG: hypothetical protein IPG89_14490 [Bacteroidetes bacterium]|nr:hypothetical protein [Bacteroidota bacterium]
MQALLAQRNRLVETKKKFSVPTAELVFIADKELSKKVEQSSKKIIKQIETQIIAVEAQLNELIANDEDLKQQYQFITSVQG